MTAYPFEFYFMIMRKIIKFRPEVFILFSSFEICFDPGFQPAFALKDGFLVLASSPAAIRRFAFRPARAREGEAPAEPRDIPLFRMSLHDLAQYLNAHQSALAEHIAKKNQEPPVSKEEVVRKLSDLAQICQLFSRVELVQRSDAGKLTLALRLQTALPLAK